MGWGVLLGTPVPDRQLPWVPGPPSTLVSRRAAGPPMCTRVCNAHIRVDVRTRRHAAGRCPASDGQPKARLRRGRKGCPAPKCHPVPGHPAMGPILWRRGDSVAPRVSRWLRGEGVNGEHATCPALRAPTLARGKGCSPGEGATGLTLGGLCACSSRWELGRLPARRTGERCQPASRVVPAYPGLRPPPTRQRRRRQELQSEPTLQAPAAQVPRGGPRPGNGERGLHRGW